MTSSKPASLGLANEVSDALLKAGVSRDEALAAVKNLFASLKQSALGLTVTEHGGVRNTSKIREDLEWRDASALTMEPVLWVIATLYEADEKTRGELAQIAGKLKKTKLKGHMQDRKRDNIFELVATLWEKKFGESESTKTAAVGTESEIRGMLDDLETISHVGAWDMKNFPEAYMGRLIKAVRRCLETARGEQLLRTNMPTIAQKLSFSLKSATHRESPELAKLISQLSNTTHEKGVGPEEWRKTVPALGEAAKEVNPKEQNGDGVHHGSAGDSTHGADSIMAMAMAEIEADREKAAADSPGTQLSASAFAQAMRTDDQGLYPTLVRATKDGGARYTAGVGALTLGTLDSKNREFLEAVGNKRKTVRLGADRRMTIGLSEEPPRLTEEQQEELDRCEQKREEAEADLRRATREREATLMDIAMLPEVTERKRDQVKAEWAEARKHVMDASPADLLGDNLEGKEADGGSGAAATPADRDVRFRTKVGSSPRTGSTETPRAKDADETRKEALAGVAAGEKAALEAVDEEATSYEATLEDEREVRVEHERKATAYLNSIRIEIAEMELEKRDQVEPSRAKLAPTRTEGVSFVADVWTAILADCEKTAAHVEARLGSDHENRARYLTVAQYIKAAAAMHEKGGGAVLAIVTLNAMLRHEARQRVTEGTVYSTLETSCGLNPNPMDITRAVQISARIYHADSLLRSQLESTSSKAKARLALKKEVKWGDMDSDEPAEEEGPAETLRRADGGNCWNCGKPGHVRADCTEPVTETRTCRICGEVGHIAWKCPQKGKDDDSGAAKGGGKDATTGSGGDKTTTKGKSKRTCMCCGKEGCRAWVKPTKGRTWSRFRLGNCPKFAARSQMSRTLDDGTTVKLCLYCCNVHEVELDDDGKRKKCTGRKKTLSIDEAVAKFCKEEGKKEADFIPVGTASQQRGRRAKAAKAAEGTTAQPATKPAAKGGAAATDSDEDRKIARLDKKLEKLKRAKAARLEAARVMAAAKGDLSDDDDSDEFNDASSHDSDEDGAMQIRRIAKNKKAMRFLA